MLSYFTIIGKTNIYNDKEKGDIHDLLSRTFVIPESFKYTIYEVSDRYVARPDLLSKDIYGDVTYADVICKLNGISNPFELNEGMLLVVPDVNDLPYFFTTPKQEDNILISDEKNSKRDDVVINNTLRNSMRGSSDLVKGDVNFRIDKKNKVVIY